MMRPNDTVLMIAALMVVLPAGREVGRGMEVLVLIATIVTATLAAPVVETRQRAVALRWSVPT